MLSIYGFIYLAHSAAPEQFYNFKPIQKNLAVMKDLGITDKLHQLRQVNNRPIENTCPVLGRIAVDKKPFDFQPNGRIYIPQFRNSVGRRLIRKVREEIFHYRPLVSFHDGLTPE